MPATDVVVDVVVVVVVVVMGMRTSRFPMLSAPQRRILSVRIAMSRMLVVECNDQMVLWVCVVLSMCVCGVVCVRDMNIHECVRR